MLTTVEGIYRQGRIELDELPPDAEGARVLVTFLEKESALVNDDDTRSGQHPARRFHWEEARRIEDGFSGSVTDELFRQRSED
jgi:hypothetical protein